MKRSTTSIASPGSPRKRLKCNRAKPIVADPTPAGGTGVPPPHPVPHAAKTGSPPSREIRLVDCIPAAQSLPASTVEPRPPQDRSSFPRRDATCGAAPDRFLREREAALVLNVSTRTLQAWRYDSAGRGPTYSKFGKCVRYSLSALYEWASTREIPVR